MPAIGRRTAPTNSPEKKPIFFQICVLSARLKGYTHSRQVLQIMQIGREEEEEAFLPFFLVQEQKSW